MRNFGWRLPWNDADVPHGLLDILRGCNISCRACYNTQPSRLKSLAEVQQELAVLKRHRRLDSVSLIGGEPTLHPQLAQIVRMIKAEGVSVEIFTNGLLLDPTMLAELKAAGTDLIFLHIDRHQDRPDLLRTGEDEPRGLSQFSSDENGTVPFPKAKVVDSPVPDPRPDALRRLRVEKAAAIAAAGMEVGLTLTAYHDALEEIDEAVDLMLNSPTVDYLLVTLVRDVPAMGEIRGDLSGGMRFAAADGAPPLAPGPLTNEVMFDRLRERFGLLPFAYLGSNVDAGDPRWLSYLAGAAIAEGSPGTWAGLRASLAEKTFLKIFRRVSGRYPFYVRQSSGRFRLQLLLGALSGGYLRRNLRLIARSLRRDGTLRAKRLLFQNPAEVRSDGLVVHCAHCPDATVRYGRLVPVCIVNRVGPAL